MLPMTTGNQQEMLTRYLSADIVQNGPKIQAITGCLLILRLMILRYCLTLGFKDTSTCDRWMLRQVCPRAFDEAVSDVFDDIFRTLVNAFHDQTPMSCLRSLKRLIQDQFRLFQGHLCLFDLNSSTNKLRVVLEQTHTLSDYGMECFLSHADPRDLEIKGLF
jgi:hypothetical protein